MQDLVAFILFATGLYCMYLLIRELMSGDLDTYTIITRRRHPLRAVPRGRRSPVTVVEHDFDTE